MAIDNYIADPKGQLLGLPIPPPFGSVLPVNLLTAINVIHILTAANYAVPVSETFCTYTNSGAAGTVNATLPLASPGLTYTFTILTAQTFRATAQAGQTIRIGASVSTSGGNASAATIGNSVTIVAMDTSTWVAEGQIGGWTLA